ncbi:hypothetical protein EPUS_04973 [Endocarpon pusillum Z07020]|uniref:Uncharacterized protein n=1 Tax=Endocarpon pusillum (strain Z07020 / HMAS-L-300199) TaxID=1263415 RepID=U1HNV1_ENDPU|nr:uncharacterized protein EPUS_04973 [Endocarpon pusillum Z07020]ERF72055.1 hypothetical protein EPUS_04973 [Endocarpon pusillum Z07020]
MLPTLVPMPFDLDFMVRETAVFINLHQLELVLLLLDEHVDPIDIPEYVRERLSGVELTVKDVVEIRNGNFHISGSNFHVRMPSGNFVHIDIVDDYFSLLPTISSMSELQRQFQDEYGVLIDDHDMLDIFYGAFHVVGPKTIDLTTKEKHFVPRSDLSEAIWMFERGFSADFISRYVWYRFHSRLPAHELVRLALANNEEIVEDAALFAILKSAPARVRPYPPCLKQTARRAPPPLPIMTFPQVFDDPDVEAVRRSGETFTANPAVICHFDDGTYSLYTDFQGHLESASNTPTSTYSDETDSGPESDSISEESIKSDVASRVLVHLQDGDYLVDLEQPDLDWIQVPRLASRDHSPEDDRLSWFQSATEMYLHIPVTDDCGIQSLSQMELDIDSNFDNDLALEELTLAHHPNPFRSHPIEVQAQDPDTDFAGLPSLGHTTLDNLETESGGDFESLFSDTEGSILFDQELDAIFADAGFVDLERGNPHSDSILDLDLERGQPQSEMLFDVADPSLDDEDPFLLQEPPRKKRKSSSLFSLGCSNQVQ